MLKTAGDFFPGSYHGYSMTTGEDDVTVVVCTR